LKSRKRFFPRLVEGLRNPTASPILLTLGVSLFFAAFCNQAFWQAASGTTGTTGMADTLSPGFLASLFVVIVLLINLLFSMVAFRYLFKPVLITVLLVSSLVAYFMDHYGVMIDMPMMRNVFETNPAEIIDLLGFGLLKYLLLLGIIPSLIVYRTRITYQPFKGELLRKSAVVAVSLGLLAGIHAAYSAEYKALLKHQRNVRYVVNPISYLVSLEKYLQVVAHKTVIRPVGVDARLIVPAGGQRKHKLLVVVVGETARARDFSLNGYSRNTNPLLSKDDVIYFKNVSSCGTSTAISVPCMFSHLGREHYSREVANSYENLLDVMSHAGIKVFWRDNNHGCKGVCSRVETEEMPHYHLDSYCKDRECVDEILLYKLQEHVRDADHDMVIILHQLGSHGPAYYKRYPGEFRAFTPTCDTNQLTECTQAAIRNTYDNTILYTDYILDRVIGLLKDNSARFNTAMIYVSDHGESLGENGQYLHGAPYPVAPETQTHVPLVVWLSPEMSGSTDVDTACLRQHAGQHYSHDNLFHSVLGLMGVSTQDYDSGRDIFSGCRPPLVRMSASNHSTVSPWL